MIEIRDAEGDMDGLSDRLLGLLNAHAIEAGHPFLGATGGLVAEEADRFLGGATFEVNYRWCYLKLLAVTPEARGRGVGEELMQTLEARMRDRDLIGIWLDTRGFQAEPFYRNLGYETFAKLDGPVPAEDLIFLRKTLGAGI